MKSKASASIQSLLLVLMSLVLASLLVKALDSQALKRLPPEAVLSWKLQDCAFCFDLVAFSGNSKLSVNAYCFPSSPFNAGAKHKDQNASAPTLQSFQESTEANGVELNAKTYKSYNV